MYFQIKTLVDITSTGVRHRNNKPSLQQNNCDTVIQTISLRTNPDRIKIYSKNENCNEFFGTEYSELQKVWYLEFEPNIENSTSLEILQEDFNKVPFIQDLDETVNFIYTYFLTYDKQYKNIVFHYME